ncbi:hypothetical protein L3X38_041109 [Prunus dulcis]|uniref:Pathogenesis-related family protein n=1 Tax=Prunus dulcis TaxID=3755 RepID=A0AAD4UTS6_PRUDU|nr:hypothetical protein L3X38_041109 [Prunus dulcis]
MAASSADQKDKYRSYLYGEGERTPNGGLVPLPTMMLLTSSSKKAEPRYGHLGHSKKWVQNLLKTYENGAFPQGMRRRLQINRSEKVHSQPKWERRIKFGNSSHRAFTTTFPRGFAVEILQVYSGPPQIVYKFRHWAYMEGPFKGHAPTGELVEFYGMAIFGVDKHMKIVSVEFFYDPGELLGALVKGAKIENYAGEMTTGCPILRSTG